ncbi:hypothetical protein G7Y89_g1651 [Cudoniella acicularis]|uniref:Uncharacterized protein n=1 Tax=Cudoniella acicularis TaxID=354080 RepID=A0A8H4WA28_9HELO|nr:hypothetical protein G7Y89_g1651 [Cudoniella acicularis]
MRFINYSLLLVLALLASLCCAAPAKAATSPSPLTSSVRPKATTSSTKPKATASSQPAAAKALPILLSLATAKQEGGVLGGPPPQTTFSANAIQNFMVANFIEGIKSSFFAGALETLSKDPTFTNATRDGKSIDNVTTQIAAQELAHKATLEGLLGIAKEPIVPACVTIFLLSAIASASHSPVAQPQSPVLSATAPTTLPTSITFTALGVPQNRKLFVGWVNQANPVVYSNVTLKNGIGTADVPKGLTGIAFAALTAQDTATTVDGLSNVTLAGPAPVLMF